MDRKAIVARVRAYTRDFSASIFRTVDVVDFVNEGADRLKGRINQLSGMIPLVADEQVPLLLPASYHHLFAVYAASRCFSQDERHYQSSTLMNEFEVKLEELAGFINDGTIVIIDPVTLLPVVTTTKPEYITQGYFYDAQTARDLDKGVLGVR